MRRMLSFELTTKDTDRAMFSIDFASNYFDAVTFGYDFSKEEYDHLASVISSWCEERSSVNERELEAQSSSYNQYDDEPKDYPRVQDTVSQIITTETGWFVLQRDVDTLIPYESLKKFLSLDDRLKSVVCNFVQYTNDIEEQINILYDFSN